MSRLIWTPAALRDLQRLYRFLGKKSRDAARRAAQAIRDGGEAGNSGSMLPARRTIPACKPECALQGEGKGHDFHDLGYLAMS